MKMYFSILFVLTICLASIEVVGRADEGPQKTFKIYQIDGKPSPIYGNLIYENSIYELDLVHIAALPIPADASMYSGLTKGKLVRVFKGGGKPGDVIEFNGGIADWKVGDRVIIFLSKDKKRKLALVKGRSGYDDFESAFRPFAGNINENNNELKTAIIEMRKKIQKECRSAKSKREVAQCRYRLLQW